MLKNSIIAGLLLGNIVLIGAVVYMWTYWRPPPNKRVVPLVSNFDARLDKEAQEFTFKTGDHLGADAAPSIAGRALAISAIFDPQQQDGVIIAQGGTAHGYAIYLQDGELFFAVRRNNALTALSGGKLAAGRHIITANFSQAGELSLVVDGRPPATAQAGGAITLTPVDGLDVGADRGASVGPYPPPNAFGGTIEVVTLKTAP